jgi:hypothetical protein
MRRRGDLEKPIHWIVKVPSDLTFFLSLKGKTTAEAPRKPGRVHAHERAKFVVGQASLVYRPE